MTGPKSEAGQRTVCLPKVVVEALEKHLTGYGQPGEGGVLFTGPKVSRSLGRSCPRGGERRERRLVRLTC